jgi:hypothetical protein
MSSSQAANIEFTQPMAIAVPQKTTALPVPVHYWNQLVKRIRTCTDSSATFESLGWGLIGIGSSSGLTALTLPLSLDLATTLPNGSTEVNYPAVITIILLWVAGAAGLLSGIASMMYARRHRSDRNELRQIIADDMDLFAQQHLPDAQVPKIA